MLPLKVRGLSLTSLEDALRVLMSTWIIQALLPGQLNLQILLRYHIMQLQLSCHGSWGPSTMCLFSPNLFVKDNSKVWYHIVES